MSSESVEAVSGAAEQAQGLVPKLRFPEFRDAGAWEETPLKTMCAPIKEKVGNALLTPVSITAGTGFVSQASKFGRDISGDQYKNYIYLRKGDFAYNKGNSKKFAQGYVCQLHEFDEAAASSAFICFRLNKGNAPGFFQAVFDQNVHGRQLASYITSGARSDGLLNIKPDDFFGIKIPVPPKPAEQQKIADCLSSLDAVIAAEGDRLAALKDHKKGLMQQLFPAKDQTAPRLRFPEFEGTGEWEPKTLGDVVNSLKTGKLDANAMVENGPYRFYTCAKNYYRIDHYAFEGEALLVAGNGAHLGYIHHYIGKFNAYQRTYVLQDFKANVVFLRCLLERYLPARILSEKKDGNTPYIVLSTLSEMPLRVPHDLDEQRRIADCLNSLTDLTAAQADRIDVLKTHKKALMQQLFPSPARATA